VVETELGEASAPSSARLPRRCRAPFAGSRRITLGADKGYDAREFVDDLRD